MGQSTKQKELDGATSALVLSVFAMIIAFAIWASISPMASQIQKLYDLSATEKSILVAIPVLLGSIMRIPLGIMTDRYGGKKLYTFLMIFLVIPTIGIGFANSYIMMSFWALFIGMAGTSFAIAIAYVSKFYPPEKQGFVLGLVGMGNIGTAVAGFTIPTLVNNYSIPNTFWILAVASGITAVIFWFGTKEMPLPKEQKTMSEALSVLKYKQTWVLSLFYFVTFGAFVAFGIYLPTLLQDLFQLDPVESGLKAAGFVVLATLLRPIGGLVSDKIGAAKVLNFVFLGTVIGAIILAFSNNFFLFSVGALSVSTFVGLGNGAVFKLVPQYFPKNTGAVTGIVGAAGGLGGFFPPILMGIFKDLTGNYLIGFILLALFTFVNFIVNRKFSPSN